MLVMVVFFIAFRWIHLSTPLIRLFLLVLTDVSIDRKSGSAGMLRSTLFPYTTLFRSSLTVNAGNGGFLHCIQMDTSVNAANQVVSVGANRCIHRSEERFSRNAEIYTLSLHDALPI